MINATCIISSTKGIGSEIIKFIINNTTCTFNGETIATSNKMIDIINVILPIILYYVCLDNS